MTARTPDRTPRWQAVFRLMAAAVLATAMLAATAVASAAPASAAPARAAAARPAVGTAPLKDLIGQPVRHVKPPTVPRQYTGRPRAAKLPAGDTACPAAKPGQVSCAAISRTVRASGSKAAADRATAAKASAATAKPGSAAATAATAAAAVTGYSPAQLQAAYNVTASSLTGGTATDGTPETVAVIGAYNDPTAAADLATYRSTEGLIPCVTPQTLTSTGPPVGSGCLTTVNENNQTSPLPAAPPTTGLDWTWQESVSIDAITAMCPNCQILLVEGNSSSVADLGQSVVVAENDADFVTGDWYASEFAGETADDQAYLNAPGKALVFPAGNAGRASAWPPASQYVTSVGGTTLTADTSASRGYDETAWTTTASACTTFEAKPSWQTDTGTNGCPNRTENDVSADANPSTGAAIYDSTGFSTTRSGGWKEGGGTGLAAGLITGIYALNGLPQAGTYPASYPYQSGNSSDFNDITSGSNGTCESNRQYLCNAASGYDGPSGEGTPNGASGLAYDSSGGDTVTVPDPGVKDYAVGDQVSIPVQATDSDSSQTITYSATGLPNGLSINSATGTITGTPSDPVAATGSTSNATVTATDSNGATGTVTFPIVVIEPLGPGWTSVSGQFSVNSAATCMNDANAATTDGSPVETYSCGSAATENWIFHPGGDPGGPGSVTLGSNTAKCLAVTGSTASSKAEIGDCDGDTGQQWQIQSGGEIYNPVSHLCLSDPSDATANNTQLDLEACAGTADQQWTLPAGQLLSGINGDCVDDYQQATANASKVDLYQCNGGAAQNWALGTDSTIQMKGVCLDMTSSSVVNGGLADLNACNSTGAQSWTLEPDGEIVNLTSGKCLDDPGNNGTWGTQLEQWDCNGQPGEIWEAS